jgi:heterodisulfide reductase subunit C
MIPNIIFSMLLLAAIILFYRSVSIISRNIKLGKKLAINDNKALRWKTMFLVAIGQSKMGKRPLAGALHIIVYLGFIIVNIEMLEILIDGVAGTHRVFSFLPFYSVLINVFEILAALVIIACLIFLARRNILKVKRFHSKEMTSWPRLDANIILFSEIILMFAFLSMNAADSLLQASGSEHYTQVGTFLISSYLTPIYSGMSEAGLLAIERSAWWIHIIGVLAFLNYVPYSKHFHIFLAFPNVFYSKLQPLTYIANMDSVTKEVKIAMGLMEESAAGDEEIGSFGAKDVRDLSWKSLMDAYSCTECGRCTAVCPAHLTGKKLSPRKVVMDTRDRLEQLGKAIKKSDNEQIENKSLLRDFITEEEIWACTTCNACSFECPVNIDPVSIIIELRRYQFMEESSAPSSLNSMSTNIENNGAPWQYSAADRGNWALDLTFKN